MNDIFFRAKNNIFLAPMAGVTDRAFREVCSSFGAGLTYTEMVSGKGLYYSSKKTRELLDTSQPVAVQLFGSDAQVLAQTAAQVEQAMGGMLALIDINMGCPTPKIVRNGDGSALMDDPVKAAGIITAVRREVAAPLTVKFRSGPDAAHINAVEFAKMAQDAGADGVAVHGRTRAQMYTGKSDRDVIAAVKAAVGISVIASGDIFTPGDIRDVLQQTGCDGVMVARGSLGNPFIFAQYLADASAPTPGQRAETAVRHLALTCRYKGEERGVVEFRKHAMWYVRGTKNAAAVRAELGGVKTQAEMRELLTLGTLDTCYEIGRNQLRKKVCTHRIS